MGVSKPELDKIIKHYMRVFPLSAAEAQHCTEAQFERAYEMFEDEHEQIPSVAAQLGIPYEIAEKISRYQLHIRYHNSGCLFCERERKNEADCPDCMALSINEEAPCEKHCPAGWVSPRDNGNGTSLDEVPDL
jgi:hypothetical protein